MCWSSPLLLTSVHQFRRCCAESHAKAVTSFRHQQYESLSPAMGADLHSWALLGAKTPCKEPRPLLPARAASALQERDKFWSPAWCYTACVTPPFYRLSPSGHATSPKALRQFWLNNTLQDRPKYKFPPGNSPGSRSAVYKTTKVWQESGYFE